MLVEKQRVASVRCWPIFRTMNQVKNIQITIMNDLPRFACLFALMFLFGRTLVESLHSRYRTNLKVLLLKLYLELLIIINDFWTLHSVMFLSLAQLYFLGLFTVLSNIFFFFLEKILTVIERQLEGNLHVHPR